VRLGIGVIAGIMAPNLARALRVLLVTDDALLADRDPVETLGDAVRGGATAVQLRLKEASDRELLQLARALVASLAVPVFVNDRLDVALAAGAAGCHLGPDDLSPDLARRIAAPPFAIGASVGSEAEVARALQADYWGIGPLHHSHTKRDAGDPLGWTGAAALLARAGDRPCVVIGGVTPQDVAPAREAGFAGVAVSGGILAAPDVVAAARTYTKS
jgi:thiamine-phosphate pyrophosphorylase